MPRLQINAQDFTPQGPNYFKVGSGVLNTYIPGTYVGANFDADMLAIANTGYNTVRLHTAPTVTQAGNASAPGINNAYWDNVADAVIRCHNHGLYVILTCGGIPANGIAYPNGFLPDPSISATSYGGYLPNWGYLTADALTAKKAAMSAIIARIRAQGVTAAMLIAIEFTGEIAFNNLAYPFSLHTGSVTTATGTYSMADPASRTKCMVDGIIHSLTDQITNINTAFPGVLTMVQLAPAAVNTDPNTIFVNADIITGVKNLQMLGFSLYPTFPADLPTQIASFGVTFPLPNIVCMTLETGWLQGRPETLAVLGQKSVQWEMDSCQYGIYGSSYYDYLGSDTAYIGMTSGGGVLAAALSPTAIGDGCTQLRNVLPAFIDRAGQHYEIIMLDALGNYPTVLASTVGGNTLNVNVVGPAIAVHGVSFNPVGSVADNIGTCSFDVPLTTIRNNALARNARFLLIDRITQIEMGEYIVQKRDITGGVNGETARISAVAWSDELRRQTVTTGFSTPTPAGEPLTTTGARLASLCRFPYTFQTDLGTAFDGIAFVATGSIAGAYGKLAKERFAHWKERPRQANGTRVVFVGRGGVDTGFVLGTAPNPTTAMLLNTALRVIEDGSPQISQDFDIVNLLTPYGAGSGEAQVSLQPLFNPVGRSILPNGWELSNDTNFQGFQAGYPIYRRFNQDQSGDGYDYFIVNTASYNVTDGPWEGQWTETGIAPAGTTPADFVNAASALYTAAVAHLGWNSVPNETYQLRTAGHGDLRDLALNQVRLQYRGIAKEKTGFGTETRDVNIDVNTLLTVMSVQINEDGNGVVHADWTLSTNGQYAISDTSVIIGAINQIQLGNYTAQPYPMDRELPMYGVTDVNHVMSRTMFGNAGTNKLIQAKISVQVLPARGNWRPHAHPSPIPALPTDAYPIGADVSARPVGATSVATTTLSGGFNADISIGIDKNPPSGTANVVGKVLNGIFALWSTAADGVAAIATSSSLNTSTTSHTHGIPALTVTGSTTASPTGQGSGAITLRTGGGNGGFLNAAPLYATSNDLVDASTGWALFENPAPLPTVQVRVGGALVGTVTGAGSFDCTTAVQAAGAGATDLTITFTPVTIGGNAEALCEVNALIQTRSVISSIGKVGGAL